MSYLDAHLAKLRMDEDLQGAMYSRYVDAFDYSAESQRSGDFNTPKDLETGKGGTHLKSIVDTIRAAETFTVAPQMMSLVKAAAEQMPNEPLMPEDLPSLQGFLYLTEPFSETDLHGRILREHVVTWSVMQYRDKYGIYLNWFTDRDDQQDEVNQEIRAQDPGGIRQVGKYVLMAANAVYFGEPIPNSPDLEAIRELDKAGLPEHWRRQYLVQEEEFFDVDLDTGERNVRRQRYVPILNDDSTLTEEQFELIRQAYDGLELKLKDNYSLKQLVCFWRLCQQTIASREYAHPNRAISKMLKRKHFSASPVTVITLRRRKQVNSEGSEVEWDHRWLRRGHWRQQWYGSGEDRHQRAIYINPTICGPEDKPLLIRPHVNLLTR